MPCGQGVGAWGSDPVWEGVAGVVWSLLAPILEVIVRLGIVAVSGLVVATAVAAGGAVGLGVILEQRLAAPPPVPQGSTAQRQAPLPTAPRPLEDYLQLIMRRNLFDQDLIGTWDPGGGGTPPVAVLGLRLLGTVATVPVALSEAVILSEGEPTSRTYRIGQALGPYQVVSIERRQVTLEGLDGALRVLTLDDSADRSTGAATQPQEPTEAIQELGPGRYQLPQAMLEGYLADPGALAKLAQASPHRDSAGQIDGYSLRGIRRDSLLSQLGLRSGDVIRSADGVALDSASAVVGLVQGLSGRSELCLEVSRRRQPVELCYEVP